MDLYAEWEEKAKSVSTEYLNMSVGEIINRYKDNRMKINPMYQRHYRWNNKQKSNLIESLLLGYPIPPIFMYKNIKSGRPGEYEIIDGLQRLATIFEFVGILRDEIKPKEPLKKLEETYILKTLKDKTWIEFKEEGLDFVLESRMIQIITLDNRNELKTKYEIFRRLNSSSTKLSDQEIRNATLFETSPDVFNGIENTFKSLDFSFLSDSEKIERKDLELFLEFILIDEIIHNKKSLQDVLKMSTYSKMLDEFSFSLTEVQLSNVIEKFILFMNNFARYKFKKYNGKKNSFEGQFINAFFEILAALYLKNPQKNITEEFIKKQFGKNYRNWLSEVGLVNPDAKTRMLKAISYVGDFEK